VFTIWGEKHERERERERERDKAYTEGGLTDCWFRKCSHMNIEEKVTS